MLRRRLTKRERRELLDALVEFGSTLAEIRDDRLFVLDGHETFEGYCVGRWGLDAAEVAAIIAIAERKPRSDEAKRTAAR